MGITIDEAIEKYKNQAEWEHSHDNMDYCEEYEQLAKWLEQLQKIKQIAYPLQFCSTDKLNHEAIMKICEVLENGNVD